MATIGQAPRSQRGFTLLEALVAMAIVALVVLGFLGIRTSALMDATKARNWRIAREIAEEKLSELRAGAREIPPESGTLVPLDDKYPGFSYAIYIGESAIADMEASLAGDAGGEDVDGGRSEWQRSREMLRRASAQGLSYFEYQDKLLEEEQARERQETPPSETDFEEVAVVVLFPAVDPEQEQDDYFVLKAKISTLALSGMTTEQAQKFAESKGESLAAANRPPAAGSGSSSSEPAK